MTDQAVRYDRNEHVGTLLLSRPDNGNRMSEELLAAFSETVREAREDEALRCLIVTGEGRSFCAGADLSDQVQRGDEGSALPHERSYAMYEPFLSLLDVEVPVIGALSGHAIGGGLGLALVCDLRYAAKDAKFGATFVSLGLTPGMAVSHLLPRLVGLPVAAEWLFTGRLFSGDEGASRGVFNEALPRDEVLPRAQVVAESIAANGPLAVRLTKRALIEGLGWSPKEAAFRESFVQAETFASRDAEEGIAAAIEGRKAHFEGK